MNIIAQGEKNSEGVKKLIIPLCEDNKFERNHFYLVKLYRYFVSL